MTDDHTVTAGRLIKGVGGIYTIYTADGVEVKGKPRGLFRNEGMIPIIGDHVSLSPSGDADIPYRIEEIFPRKNALIRPPVSNIDVLVITVSCHSPKPDPKLIDKLLILCGSKSIHPLIWITKADLDYNRAEDLCELYESIGYETEISAVTEDTDEIAFTRHDELDGKTIIFAGQSGVGKSTLCNALIGSDHMEIGRVSVKLHRGKHTTRHVELIPFGDKGGFIADTPGFSSLSLTDLGIAIEEIPLGYPELGKIKDHCRFQDCRHMGEEGCALSRDTMSPERLTRYREFMTEIKNAKKYR